MQERGGSDQDYRVDKESSTLKKGGFQGEEKRQEKGNFTVEGLALTIAKRVEDRPKQPAHKRRPSQCLMKVREKEKQPAMSRQASF